MSLTPAQQDIGFAGKELIAGACAALTVSQLSARLTDDQPPVKLVGTFHLPLVPDGLPVDGQMQGTFEFRRLRNGSMLSSSGSTIAANCWSPRGVR